VSVAHVTFAPLVPWPLLAVLGAAALAIVAFGLWHRARGGILRLALFALLLAALANPVVTREQREPLADIALAVVDRSPSQTIGEREDQLEAALDGLREVALARPGLELREVVAAGDGPGGSRLFAALRQALSEIDRERLAGVVMMTDGQVHDAPAEAEALGAPLHVLLTGRPGESDRRLVVERVPNYGMVGETQELVVRVEELPAEGRTAAVPVTVRQDGEILQRLMATPGASYPVPFTIARAGQTVLEIEAETREDELTALNNRAVHFVNGVRDRLRVLLVSGQPYPGLRVWRNILKADPMVDLVHFTILRPPEKQDGTPIRELALIAFPSRELFEVKLGEFDLVIFDRYSRRGLLPLAYLDNVARYVEEGGALLEAAGPEFAHPLSLFRTPLQRVLPGRPSGVVYERGYRPELTELGRRHPVTGGLVLADTEDDAWGRWFRQVDVEVDTGQVLMSGVSDRPLLVLERVGEGRVAQLLSDHAWLWARGFEGGGPQSVMLRRLVHWLMKEPELEEEQLVALPRGSDIHVTRRGLASGPVELELIAPSGARSSLSLTAGEDGIASGEAHAEEPGLYRITDGILTTYAAVRPMSPVELSDMRASAEILAPHAQASGGAVRWLAEGMPEVRMVAPGRSTSGRGWLGLVGNERYLVTGTTRIPLFPAFLALTLLLAAAGAAWWREGRS
jgi:hypothetical protein